MAKTRSAEREKPLPLTSAVRYIKLGAGGSWESDCIKRGVIRFGFSTGENNRFPLCVAQEWDQLRDLLQRDSGNKSKGKVTDNLGQIQKFFTDDGSTVWFTFYNRKLYWGRLDGSKAVQCEDGDSVERVVAGGWNSKDIKGDTLDMHQLAGHLTRLASYRGTSCKAEKPEYLINRINDTKNSKVDKAQKAVRRMEECVLAMMKELDPKDFELLVDLVFSASGWRRLGPFGKTQKFVDAEMVLPTTDDYAFLQVKSKTTSGEIAEYNEKFLSHEQYTRMFYVYHTGPDSADVGKNVTLLGPSNFPKLVVDAGLTRWLIDKVS